MRYSHFARGISTTTCHKQHPSSPFPIATLSRSLTTRISFSPALLTMYTNLPILALAVSLFTSSALCRGHGWFVCPSDAATGHQTNPLAAKGENEVLALLRNIETGLSREVLVDSTTLATRLLPSDWERDLNQDTSCDGIGCSGPCGGSKLFDPMLRMNGGFADKW